MTAAHNIDLPTVLADDSPRGGVKWARLGLEQPRSSSPPEHLS